MFIIIIIIIIIIKIYKVNKNLAADKPPDACASRCCAVKSCPLVNDCDFLDGFCDFSLSYLTLSTMGFPRAVWFIFGMEKLEWLGYNLMKVA